MVPINLDMKFERLETISLIHFPIPLKVSSMNFNINMSLFSALCLRSQARSGGFYTVKAPFDDGFAGRVANSVELRDKLYLEGAETLEQGQISGLNGLLPGYAGLREIPAACVLASMPQYGTHVPNPKASRGIVRFLSRLLGLQLDMEELDESVAAADLILEKLAG